MRNRSTISFIGLWEVLHNPDFNCFEFEAIKNEAGDNGFVMTPKRWIENNAILIEQGKVMSERLILLRQLAIKQMESLSLVNMREIKQLPGADAYE